MLQYEITDAEGIAKTLQTPKTIQRPSRGGLGYIGRIESSINRQLSGGLKVLEIQITSARDYVHTYRFTIGVPVHGPDGARMLAIHGSGIATLRFK